MPDANATTTSGVDARGYRRFATGTGPWDQFVVPVEDKIISYQGRVTTFQTPGRAAVGQKVFALHNATASPILVRINRIKVDLLTTVVKAATVIPPVIRAHRFTAVPTSGTVLSKSTRDTGLTSNGACTAWGDASADGVLSATTLTITPGLAIDQEWSPRMLSAVGYEQMDAARFFEGEPDITLRPLEGVCVFLNLATVTTGNPATDSWLITCDWDEYTRP